MLKLSAAIAAASLFVAAPAFAADEVDCILNKFSPAQYEVLAIKTINDLTANEEAGMGEGAEREAAEAFGVFAEQCVTEHGWNEAQDEAAGDYTLLALAAHGARIQLQRQGAPVDGIDRYYAANPGLKTMPTPEMHVSGSPQTDDWSTKLILDMRKAGVAVPDEVAPFVPNYIALLAWRDQRRAQFGA